MADTGILCCSQVTALAELSLLHGSSPVLLGAALSVPPFLELCRRRCQAT